MTGNPNPPKRTPHTGTQRRNGIDMSMNRQTIKEAKAEAQTFIKACDEALARLDAENDDRAQWYAERHASGIDEPTPSPGPHPHDHSYGSKQTGTLRRKSMDLTRILATLRRYGA